MKPSTLDPEEGQPLLADSPTTRRTTPKVLAAAVIGLLGVAAVASSQTSPSPVQVLDAAPLCNSSVETSAVSTILPTFATDLYDKVNAPIEDAINDYFADSVLPSVDSCSS